MTKNYVNNKDFYNLICEYRKECEAALAAGKPEPRIPEEAGRLIILIADRYARRPNFRNYYYIDEMKLAAIESAIKAFNNFDVNRFNNPLAYFTQCIHFAFIGYITKEKKDLYARVKMVQEGAFEYYETLDGDDTFDSSQHQFLMEFLDKNEHDITFGFLDKKKDEPAAAPKKEISSPLDQFFQE